MSNLAPEMLPSPLIPPPSRSHWETALARYEATLVEAAAFDAEYERIETIWREGQPSMEEIHWKAFPFADRDHVARILDLSEAERQRREGQNKWWWAKDPTASLAEFCAALESVQQFRDAEERHEIQSGFRAASERYESLTDAISDASDLLMAMPAPDAAALRWKLDQLKNKDGSFAAYSSDYMRQINEDIARILGPAG